MAQSPRRWVWLTVFIVLVAVNIPIAIHLLKKEPPPLPPVTTKPAVAPLEARTRLVDTLVQETMLVSLENLANFDDTVWVSGSMSMDGEWMPPCSFRYERRYIPRLNRVRKILQQARDEPQQPVLIHLKDQLRKSAEGFENLFWARGARLDELAKEGRGLDLDEPDEYYRRGIVAPAATYILTELKCFDALPIMADIFEQKGHVPVSRLTLFYAMHLLARDFPRDKLGPAASDSLIEYLNATRDLPQPYETKVTAWNASLEDTDFRAKVVGQDIGLEEQPQTVLRIYPSAIETYEEMDEFSWFQPTAPVKDHFVKLRRFISLAYPRP